MPPDGHNVTDTPVPTAAGEAVQSGERMVSDRGGASESGAADVAGASAGARGRAGAKSASSSSAGPAVDRKAWVREAVERYERPLVQYAAHILGGDVERARDLVQDAFLKLCDQDTARVGSHLAEWLYTVCRNGAIDVKRKERRMQLLSEAQTDSYTTDEPAPGDAAEQEDTLSSVLRAMQDLPDNQQEVIRLKFQHGLSYKQISAITNLTVTNVGFLIHTGIKTLRRELVAE